MQENAYHYPGGDIAFAAHPQVGARLQDRGYARTVLLLAEADVHQEGGGRSSGWERRPRCCGLGFFIGRDRRARDSTNRGRLLCG